MAGTKRSRRFLVVTKGSREFTVSCLLNTILPRWPMQAVSPCRERRLAAHRRPATGGRFVAAARHPDRSDTTNERGAVGNQRSIMPAGRRHDDPMTKAVDFIRCRQPGVLARGTQLPRLCEEAGATLVYRPMLLGGVFQATGNASPMTPAKGRYVFEDLSRYAPRYGVPLKHNAHFPIHTLLLMRGATAMQPSIPIVSSPTSMWSSARSGSTAAISTTPPSSRPSCSARASTRRRSWPRRRSGRQGRAEDTTDEAIARGVFGAPTMFVGSSMFFGQDRLDFVREASTNS